MGEEKGERVYEVGDTGFKTSDFVHLHNHTHHLLMKSITKAWKPVLLLITGLCPEY